MNAFTSHRGLIVPLDIANVDTDAIIPKQFLQKVTRSGFGQHLFHDWRFFDQAGIEPNPDFILNQPIYQGTSILLARENFGCGSSREHAPWALMDYGFKVIIAPSFADIFYNNCFNNQLLAITLAESHIDQLFERARQQPLQGYVDLVTQTMQIDDLHYAFALDPFRRECLLKGLDNIALTLQHTAAISAYEAQQPPFLR